MIIASIISAGEIGIGCHQSDKVRVTRIEPQPLSLTKPEDEAYITRQEYNEDIKRLYVLYHEQTTQLNLLIGLVSGINKNLQSK